MPELRGKRWDNARAIERIANKRIRSLDVFDTLVDDAFLVEVAKAGSLESLHISSDEVTDVGIIAIAENTPICSLMLSGLPKVTNNCLAAIGKCRTIHEIYLEGTQINDDSLSSLREMKQLWSLSIDNSKITDAGIRELGPNNIKLISFENCLIEGDGFSSWKQTEKMSFYGDNSGLTDEGFAICCEAFPFLWNVIISNTEVSDAGIQCLSGQKPTMLRINGTKITREGIQWIVDTIPVQGLDVDEKQITASDAERHKKSHRRLSISFL